MFTLQQIKEIASKLKMFGIKDSEFKETDSVKHDDKVAIVQEGDNRIVSLEELAEYIVRDVREEFRDLERRLKAVEDAIAGGTVTPPPVEPDKMVTLTVSVYPEDALVYMDGECVSEVTVKEGTAVSILVERDGYETYTAQHIVTETETIEIKLEKIENPSEISRDLVLSFDGEYEIVPASGGNWEMVASLVINYSDGTNTTNDVTDSVEVTIDNEELKYNGGAFYWLENTAYESRLAHVDVRYENLNKRFTSLQSAAQRNMYVVAINPTPSDATVKIDGVVRNSVIANEGDTVSYEVSREGYETATGSVVADEDKTIDVVLVEQKPVEPTMVRFAIVATPADAVVIINGEQRKEITVEKGETVEWSVSKGGYIPKTGTRVCTDNNELSVSLVKIEMTGIAFEIKSIDGEYGSVPVTGGSFTITAKLTKKYNYGDDIVSDVDINDCTVTTTGDLVHDGGGVFVWGENTSDMRSSVINIVYSGDDVTKSIIVTSTQLGVSDYVIINNGKDLSFTSASASKDIDIRANVDWEITIKQ